MEKNDLIMTSFFFHDKKMRSLRKKEIRKKKQLKNEKRWNNELGKVEDKRYKKKQEELQKKKEEHQEGKEITDHIEKKKDISENRDTEKKKREDTDDGNTGSRFKKTVEMNRGKNKKRKRDEDAKYDGGKNDVQKRIKQIERDQVEDNKMKTWEEIQTRPECVEIRQVIRIIPANEKKTSFEGSEPASRILTIQIVSRNISRNLCKTYI